MKPLWDGGYEAETISRLKERNREDRLAIDRRRRQLTKQEKACAGWASRRLVGHPCACAS